MKPIRQLLPIAFAWFMLAVTGRASISATFNSATDVGVTASSYAASGTATFTLDYAPAVGTELMVVKNTGLGFITGSFSNLAQGQSVSLSYSGVTYEFVANYYGGTGNDLVLVWKNNRPLAWGWNERGQLGNNSTTQSNVPVAVNTSGALAGKTVVAVSAGQNHSLALCSDGTLAAWGYNYYGQLGNNSATDSLVPVAVDTSGVLSGKTVVAIAAGGADFSMALCSDGTVAAWGYNGNGQLGNNSTTDSPVPVAVNTSGVLSGKTVVAVAAGQDHSLALCSDGTVAAWGRNGRGQLGNGDINYPDTNVLPVAVNTSGILSGKTVVAIAGGGAHSLALCSDGTVAAWGRNHAGQLGNGNINYTDSNVPVAVNTSGALSGKTVVALAAGVAHSLALCSDGTVAAWGWNGQGQLGNNSTTKSNVPVAVNTSGVLSGKTVVTLAAGSDHGVVLCSDDTLASWGWNWGGPLGNNSTTNSLVPVAVNTGALAAGERFTKVGIGPYASHTLALVAAPPTGGLTATFNSATDVGVAASSYTASGTVTCLLGYAPAAGTELMVVKNTGLGFITGSFSNLAQGQSVALDHNGVTYEFVANYYGGTGNDLVLVWKNNRPMAWGWNNKGQLGNNSTSDSFVPAAVNTSGVLSGKTVVAIAAGRLHGMALCSDGTVAAWGYNFYGQLGNNSTTDSLVPVAVDTSGVLSGKTVVAVAAGDLHSMALCSDGTVAAWGYNFSGQLGNNSTTDSPVPVAVNTSGVLSGKTVVAVAAGHDHSLALCSDGTVAAWGWNNKGQLGNNSSSDSLVPVAVNTGGALSGKTVVAVAAGQLHSLAVCSDGTAAAWGWNDRGQLGNNSSLDSLVPVAVDTSGLLSGKTVVAVAAGTEHSMALCSDGTLAAWGYNDYGQLGDNTTNDSSVPTAVDTSGVLSGKTIVSAAAGGYHSMALCSDGTATAWGYNGNGQLGDSTTNDSSVPVAVNTGTLAAGERFTKTIRTSLANYTLALVAIPVVPAVTPPVVTDPTFADVTASGATLGGNVTGDGGATVTERGVVISKTSENADPAIGGIGVTKVTTSGTTGIFTVGVSGLSAATGYSFKAYATNSAGTTYTSVTGFTSLALPPTVTTPTSAAITATAATLGGNVTGDGGSAITERGVVFSKTSDNADPVIGGTGVTKVTTSGTTGVFTVGVSGLSPATGYSFKAYATNTAGTTYTSPVSSFTSGLLVTFNSATDVGVTAPSYAASGTVTFVLGYAPVEGTDLMVVKNTGLGLITGQFSNLAQGQSVALSYGGLTYQFVANYYGGTGNDLVLQWANLRLLAWGRNDIGQLGNNSTTNSSVPVAVNTSGVLAGKTVAAVAAGGFFNIALCPDGTLASWGANGLGELGNNSTTSSSVPVALNTSGLLSGKTVVTVAAGHNHSVALCSDGTVAAWGYNSFGQLGNNSTTSSSVPVAVNTSGVLAGKTVVAVTARGDYSVALCSDGTVAAWGRNDIGQLGNNSTTSSSVPVAVNTSGVLSGKTVVAVAAGGLHSMALCSDGTLAAWGYNSSGQLGNNSTTNSSVPVAVNTSGVLAGKTVVAVEAGSYHSVALCSDGTLAAWGANGSGELGNNSTTSSSVPVAVNTSGVLAGKTVMAVEAGQSHSLALCSDGTLAAWGENGYGQIGNNSTANSLVPVAVNTSGALAGRKVAAVVAGYYHTLALMAAPPVPVVTTPTSTAVTASSATLGGNVTSDGGSAITERGVIISKTSENADPAIGGTGVTKVTTSGTTGVFTVGVSGLSAGTGYSFKVYATNSGGTAYTSPAATFTTALSASQAWRLTWFGTTENTGNAADSAAPDGDGIENLLKYGLVLQPGVSGAASLPVAQPRSYAEGERLALVFTRDPARNDITIEIQVSDSPSGPWTTVAISVNGAPFTGSGYVGETDAGGGLKTVEVRDVVNIADATARFMRILVTR